MVLTDRANGLIYDSVLDNPWNNGKTHKIQTKLTKAIKSMASYKENVHVSQSSPVKSKFIKGLRPFLPFFSSFKRRQKKEEDRLVWAKKALGENRLVLEFSTFSCSANAINSSLHLLNNLVHSVSKKTLNRSDLMGKRLFNRLSKVHVELKNTKNTKSSTRFTVIRSPFVFKKTREQFTRLHIACTVVLLMSKPQQQFLLQLLTISKFPAELSVLSYA